MSIAQGCKHMTLGLLLVAAALHGLAMAGERQAMFRWQQDELFRQLEEAFRVARELPAADIRPALEVLVEELDLELERLAAAGNTPPIALLTRIETLQFRLAALAAAQAEFLTPAQVAIHRARLAVLEAARRWSLDETAVRDAVYRVIYGGRNAIEEALIQNPDTAFPALSLLAADPEPRPLPAVEIEGVRLYSGDIILSRGNAPTSALIARGNPYPGNFSHVALLHVDADTGEAVIVQSLIEAGAVVTSIDEFFGYRNRRLLVLRLRADHPALVTDPTIPHRAASDALANIRRHHIPYDFALQWDDPARMFCAEVPYHAYRKYGVDLWRWRSHLTSPGLRRWLGDLGVRQFHTIIPSDIEYDPALMPIAEWRDLAALRRNRLDNAVLDVLLEAAEEGVRLDYPWYKYPLYALAKAWSWLVSLFGAQPPIPEGMSIPAALRVSALVHTVHPRLYAELDRAAQQFHQRQGYAPPYWHLLSLAHDVLEREKTDLPLK